MVSHELTACVSVFDLFLTQWVMAVLSKGCKADGFQSHDSLKLSFTSIQVLCSWIMSKMYICKSKFHVSYHIFDMKILGEKTLLTLLSRLPKIINLNKKWHNFYFHTSLWCLRKVSFFWSCKNECENKKLCDFPTYSIGTTRVRTAFCQAPYLYNFCFLSNGDTYKQYWHFQGY